MAFRWDITPRLGFSQDASAFLADNSSFVSTSALTTRLFGALSSRLSFDVRHETEPPAGSVKTDTVSRVTLLYSFRSEEHTSELQSLMRISYAVFCLKKKKKHERTNTI